MYIYIHTCIYIYIHTYMYISANIQLYRIVCVVIDQVTIYAYVYAELAYMCM